jgi:hypothetical protein
MRRAVPDWVGGGALTADPHRPVGPFRAEAYQSGDGSQTFEISHRDLESLGTSASDEIVMLGQAGSLGKVAHAEAADVDLPGRGSWSGRWVLFGRGMDELTLERFVTQLS